MLISCPVRQKQEAARRKRLHQGAHDAVRVLVVGQEVKKREQRQSYGAFEVEVFADTFQQDPGLPHIRMEEGGAPLSATTTLSIGHLFS